MNNTCHFLPTSHVLGGKSKGEVNSVVHVYWLNLSTILRTKTIIHLKSCGRVQCIVKIKSVREEQIGPKCN